MSSEPEQLKVALRVVILHRGAEDVKAEQQSQRKTYIPRREPPAAETNQRNTRSVNSYSLIWQLFLCFSFMWSRSRCCAIIPVNIALT